jgi:hypothetical protein
MSCLKKYGERGLENLRPGESGAFGGEMLQHEREFDKSGVQCGVLFWGLSGGDEAGPGTGVRARAIAKRIQEMKLVFSHSLSTLPR